MSTPTLTKSTQATLSEPLVPVNFMGTPNGGFRFGQARIDFQAYLATLSPAPTLKIDFGTVEFQNHNRPPAIVESSKNGEDVKSQEDKESNNKVLFGGVFTNGKIDETPNLKTADHAKQHREILIRVDFNQIKRKSSSLSRSGELPVFRAVTWSENMKDVEIENMS